MKINCLLFQINTKGKYIITTRDEEMPEPMIINDSFEDLDGKNKFEETEDKFYYDIPIKDFKKKSSYKDTGNFFNKLSTPDNFERLENEKSKKKILEEILKNAENPLLDIKDRPFTPPFTKLIPMGSLKSLEKVAMSLEKSVDNNNNK